MHHFLSRMFLGGVLCAVAVGTSACFLRLALTRVDVTTIGDEVTQVLNAVFGNVTVAVCADLRGTFPDTTVDCTYVFGDPDEFPTVVSTAELIHDFGLFGVIIDPVILQVPLDVTDVSGTFAKTGEASRPLVISAVSSFFAGPGVEVMPEPGRKFIIVDFPADALSALTGSNTFDFTLQLSRSLPASPPPPSTISLKAMLTGKVEAGSQTFYLPLFPCVTDFSVIPALNIPVNATQTSILPQLVTLVGRNANLACHNPTYDFTPVSLPTDHFQCYKAKDSKGSLPFAKGLQVTLTDQFESGLFDVSQPAGVCNPANASLAGVKDPDTHLMGYPIKLAKKRCAPSSVLNANGGCKSEEDCGGTTSATTLCRRQPAHQPRIDLHVLNEFHSQGMPLRLDTIKVDRLFVPSGLDLANPAPLPDPTSDVDHFKCYTVKPHRGAPKFEPILAASIVDAFTAPFHEPTVFDLKKPTRLCTPVMKNGEPIKHEASHLLCYQIKAVKRPPQPRHTKVLGIFVNDQFGPAQIDTIKEAEFCVPSFKLSPP